MPDPDPRESAIETAEELRDDLREIAESDLPFSQDAQSILSEINKNE